MIDLGSLLGSVCNLCKLLRRRLVLIFRNHRCGGLEIEVR